MDQPTIKPTAGAFGVAELSPMAMGGGFEGASRLSKEMGDWLPDLRPDDVIINPNKELLDGRGREIERNDGFVNGATQQTQDSIVGTQYILNAKPNNIVLGATDGWAEEFQLVAEAVFNTAADSDRCWFDTQGRKTLTDFVRQGVGQFVSTGEVLLVAEWMRESSRPFKTAVTSVDPARLTNPQERMDTLYLRRGIELNNRSRPIAYNIRNGHKFAPYINEKLWTWDRIEAELPWGRPQVLHIYDQVGTEQSRGVAALVSVLKEMRMTKRYRDLVLENAATQSMYAAAIESDLPDDVLYQSMGVRAEGAESQGQVLTPDMDYMRKVAGFQGGAKSVKLDGVKIPHLWPGTKLKFFPSGKLQEGDYEARLLRYLASAFGLSYEEFSRDFTQTNYSSARAAMLLSWRSMSSKKKRVADKIANFFYNLWVEEMISMNALPLPKGRDRSDFYKPLFREAYTQASWVGAARGQIDELKETNAAAIRVANNVSTLEDECARLGKDWREVIKQRSRELKMMRQYDVPVILTAGPGETSDASLDEPAKKAPAKKKEGEDA